jgi:transaldolase
MKFFLDTADIEAIRKWNDIGVIDGVTTNPTLVAKVKRNFVDVVKEISQTVNGPISAEVISMDTDGMVREARILAGLAKNIVIKIPMTEVGMKAVRILAKEGIKSNVTLVFSLSQVVIAAKMGATFISTFIGRLDDTSYKGMELVREAKLALKNYNFNAEIIVASIRHPLHVAEAFSAGADIATIPPDVLEKMFKHPLTDIGIKRFLEDWEKIPGNLRKIG